MPAVQKNAQREKLDFQLHLALIQKQDNCTKNKATFQAWLEGRKGLDERLNVKH